MLSLETMFGFFRVAVALYGQKHKIQATHSPVHQLLLSFIKKRETYGILNNSEYGKERQSYEGTV